MQLSIDRRVWGVVLVALSVALAGCLGGGVREEQTPRGFSVLRVGEVGLAGQPSKQDLADLSAAGYQTVISLRQPGEIDWNEQTAVNESGMRFGHFPMSVGSVEVGLLARIRSVIEMSPSPVLLHCGSANRAALVWGMLEAGNRSSDEIRKIAQRAGLRGSAVGVLDEYLRKHDAGEGRLR